MNVKRVDFTQAERAEIASELKKEHPAYVYKRLMVLKFKAIDGMRSDETGKLLELYTSSVNRIVNRYKAGGMEVIVGKRHSGGNQNMNTEEEAAFLERFREQSEAGHVIEVTEIYQAYQKAVGHPVTRNAIYYLLSAAGVRRGFVQVCRATISGNTVICMVRYLLSTESCLRWYCRIRTQSA